LVITSNKPPLIALHGGPGATHGYLLSMADLGKDRKVVFYDQIGNGHSTHLPDRGEDFWTVHLFVRELRNLVTKPGIGAHHVLGQSWGGFLAQEYALTRPDGLTSLLLADTAASFPEFLAEANRLRALLPPDVEQTLRGHEEAGTTDDPEYRDACDIFYRRHVCRLADWPADVVKSFKDIDADPTVYHTMNGPSEFHVIGSIRDWQAADRLPEISVPVLLVSGRHDEVGPIPADAADRAAGRRVDRLRRLVAHAALGGTRTLHGGRRQLAPPPRRLSECCASAVLTPPLTDTRVG
jgi:L-proline amide hydrolase